jgi:prepilin-type N-terminal cleavage/methylation domain-containing protein
MSYLNARGYTLLEILITLSIVMILALGATVSYRSLYLHLRLHLVAQQLISELSLARSAAVSRRTPITYGALDNWNGVREIRLSNGDCLHRFAALPTIVTLELRNSLGENKQIHFLPLGFTREQRGSFYLCSHLQCLRIVVTVSGLTHLEISNLSPLNLQKIL